MAKTQTRRTISVNRALFEEAKKVAEHGGTSLAHFTEKALRAAIGTLPDRADEATNG